MTPGSKILLVDASSSTLSDLLAAEEYAGAYANHVSNSWGPRIPRGER